ncbi:MULTISPECIES: hypothetical protein [unclassified Sphingomonas]|uniref:hypothetical protein n=1 Tax=Novosphingobium rhizosphaerae TaxID=1551649 RepID=UPI0015C7FC80
MPIDAPPVAPISAPASSAPPAAQGQSFDLARLKPEEARCGSPAADGAIVVCAVDREKFRVHPLTGPFADQAPPVAQLQLAPGVKAQAEAEQRAVGGGVSVPSAMVWMKIDF